MKKEYNIRGYLGKIEGRKIEKIQDSMIWRSYNRKKRTLWLKSIKPMLKNLSKEGIL